MFAFHATVPCNKSTAAKLGTAGSATVEDLLDFHKYQLSYAYHEHEPVKKKQRVSYNIGNIEVLPREEKESDVDCITLAHINLTLVSIVYAGK